MKKRNKCGKPTLFFVIILFIIFVAGISQCRTELKTYTVSKFPCEAVFLLDIHNMSFNTDSISERSPDLILIAGDIINAKEDDLIKAANLLNLLSEIAPVYISLGNHELEYEQLTGIKLSAVFEENGATVLDKTFVDVEINNTAVRIGGIYGYCLHEDYKQNNAEEIRFLRDFENTDSYKILMDHLPYSWSHYGITADYDVDLVLSGHTHGGQVILPFFGGVYDQEFGFFPGKVRGIFENNGTTVIVSRGLGSSNERLPRINNPGEIVVICPLLQHFER